MPAEIEGDIIERLSRAARETRAELLTMIHGAGSGHPGGSLSCVDILVYLYERELRIRPEQPDWQDRDRLVLSKGHACPALYSLLAHRGYFDPKLLATLRQPGSILQGVPDMRLTPGVDMTTGSLGIGFSAAVGMALAAMLRGSPARVFCIIGDGEIASGMIWEGFLFAAHRFLKNLVCILDHNRFSSDSPVEAILNVEPYVEKLRAFGWDTIEVDGHDFLSIASALSRQQEADRPLFVVAHTVKGKGVTYMENDPAWHGSLALSSDELDRAIAALDLRGAI